VPHQKEEAYLLDSVRKATSLFTEGELVQDKRSPTMTATKSAHNADDADNPDASTRNTTGPDKTGQRTHTHKNTWKWGSLIWKLLSSLIIGFFIFFIVYIYLSREIDISSALLVACSMALLFSIGRGYLLWHKVHNDTTMRMAKSRNAASLPEKAPTKKPGNRRATLQPDVFDLLVQEAVNSIPDEFQKHMDNLAILIEDEPDAETLERVGSGEGRLLLGLYQGVPLTSFGSRHALLPQRITIYQYTIEAYCHNDPERIRTQIRKTILHEVAHHFGMQHEEMPIWIQ
jgi:predicted Zn-dependent protease with MMP-like domain